MNEPTKEFLAELSVIARVQDEMMPHFVQLIRRTAGSRNHRADDEEFPAFSEEMLSFLEGYVITFGITFHEIEIVVLQSTGYVDSPCVGLRSFYLNGHNEVSS